MELFISSFSNHIDTIKMNKSLLQKFFAYQEEPIQETPVEEVPVEEDTSFEDEVNEYDSILKRNWFLDRQHIADCLWDASEEVFGEIVNRKDTYPEEVQQVIYQIVTPVLRKNKWSIRVVSHEESNLREFKERKEKKKQHEDAWEMYKSTQNPQPPLGPLDEEMDVIHLRLESTKKELEIAKKKAITGKYITPSMREKIVESNPRVIHLRGVIQSIENEIERQNYLIGQSHNEWFVNRRNQFEREVFLV